MESVNENNKIKRKNKISIVVIIISALLIIGCGGYLGYSQYMIKKYDVKSFKLGKYELPTFNSAIKSKKKLLVAIEKEKQITLKYDITKAKLNDVYAYLEKLSTDEGFIVVNLEDTYIRTVNKEKDIQLRIKTSTNHLIFEYTIGIDYDEPSGTKEEKKEEEKKPSEATKTE